MAAAVATVDADANNVLVLVCFFCCGDGDNDTQDTNLKFHCISFTIVLNS